MPTPPWKQNKPAEGESKTKLTPESIEWARERARLAGRRYPNLVDNMAATQRQREAEHPGPSRDHP
uniref:hypothetical protein n=1 Tax=Cephaloticoccus sp. TaxID=1985742 RepID=UPI004048F5AA